MELHSCACQPLMYRTCSDCGGVVAVTRYATIDKVNGIDEIARMYQETIEELRREVKLLKNQIGYQFKADGKTIDDGVNYGAI